MIERNFRYPYQPIAHASKNIYKNKQTPSIFPNVSLHVYTIRYTCLVIFLTIVLCAMGSMLFRTTNTQTVVGQSVSPYYKSITIQAEDTLWNIEEKYNNGMDGREQYISAIKKMNNMNTDTLYSGQNLIIYYY